MDMGLRINGGVNGVVIVLMVLALANSVNGHKLYSCWGSCYNGCWIGTSKTTHEKIGCYHKCLKGCVPSTPADFQHYCQMGCSLKRCIPVISDGAKLESCLGTCTNICKGFGGSRH